MSIDRSDLNEILEKYGTPAYVIDIDFLEERFERLKSAFPKDTTIAYAVKSNYTPSLVRKLRDMGTNFDVFSSGELEYLLENDCDPEKVIFTTVAETAAEFEHALKQGVRRFVLGSLRGVQNFKRALKTAGVEDVEVMLRIQPIRDVSASTSTSGEESKFGTVRTDDGDSIENAVSEIRKDLELEGFHFHLGTQVEDPKYYEKAIDETLQIAQETGVETEILDIGGGYPAKYTERDAPLEEYGGRIDEKIDSWREKLGDFQLIIEPGRSLVAESTVLIARVLNVKEMYDRYVIILDVGGDMIELEQHDPDTSIELINDTDETFKAAIAGNLCHSRDWIMEKPRKMKKTKPGDPLIFKKMGAYVINKNNTYNLKKIPKIITKRNNKLNEERHPFNIITKTQQNLPEN